MKSQTSNREQLTFWQLIFSQSKVNGALYDGDMLPISAWHWPTDTYFQRRRSLRQRQSLGSETDFPYSESGLSEISAPVSY